MIVRERRDWQQRRIGECRTAVLAAGRDRAWIFVLLIGVECEVEGDAVRKPASNERAVDVLRAVVGIVDPGDLPAPVLNSPSVSHPKAAVSAKIHQQRRMRRSIAEY
ncbi:MAG: hypothetical protein AMJ63_11900 [Myxococcales bacterium SG8_38_1]|nr:MAG: hypothetical protein AMJ63_11900 [Myxococcales bacterium SG8_38_1]